MKLTLSASIRGDYYSGVASIEIPELYRKEFDSMDVCSDEWLAPIVGAVTVDKARIVMRAREDAAEILAENLAKMIVNEMSKNDTKNGY